MFVVFFVIHRRKGGNDGTQHTDSVELFIIAKVPSVEEVAFSKDSSLSCILGKVAVFGEITVCSFTVAKLMYHCN